MGGQALRCHRPTVGCVSDGAGEPVQIDGVVPGAVAGGWFGLHALNSATEATSGTNAVAAATLRPLAGLTMGRAYPGDDAGRNGPRWGHPQPRSGEGASGIISSSPATMRAGTARGAAGCSSLDRYGAPGYFVGAALA